MDVDWFGEETSITVCTTFSSPWRIRRWLKRVNIKFEEKLDKKYQRLQQVKNMELTKSPTSTPVIHGVANTFVLHFLRSFNPAKTGLDILQMSRHDHRVAPKQKRRVSVHLRDCLRTIHEQIASNVLLFPAYKGLVYNSFGPMNLPLIVDTGASCGCITPLKDDFIPGTYKSSSVKIKDLSGSNKVAGRGLIRWNVKDKFGQTQVLKLKVIMFPMHQFDSLVLKFCTRNSVAMAGRMKQST
jgi:hypothetical protein